MGTVIISTGVSQNGKEQSIISLASSAGLECISKAGIDKNEVDLLISTGIYKDHNVMEPAMATLIQQRMGINLLCNHNHSTFAFDILNGACGVLSAVQAAGAMLATKKIKRALVLSSDVHPSRNKVKDFPYSSIGAAMLLEWSDDPSKGFQSIDFKTSSMNYVGLRSEFNVIRHGANTKNTVDFHIEPDFEERTYSFTIETIRHLLTHYKKSHSLDTSRLKLIPAHLWKEFASKISKALGLSEQSPECLYNKYGNPNSAALTVAYHEALTNGEIKSGDQLVLLSASTGLNVAAGLYFT